MRHFLRDDDLNPAEQGEVLALAQRLKRDRFAERPYAGPRSVAVVFDKPTLRTQVSFSAGIADLGGHPLVVDGRLAQIGERETVADTARVLGRQAATVVWRTFAQTRVEEMAAHAGVPVVNALTDQFHPCQLLADLLTLIEHGHRLPRTTVCFLGDTGSNMAHSYLLAGATAGMRVRLAGPDGFRPDPSVLDRAAQLADRTGGEVSYQPDPGAAVTDADVVVTDTWVSMGTEQQAGERDAPFWPYALTPDLLTQARAGASVLHCLPAHRGREIAAEVIDGPQSLVWDEAENRLHAQKALLAWLMRHADRREVPA